MIEEIELYSFLLALCALVFISVERSILRQIRGWSWLYASYVSLTLSLGASVIEGLWLFDFFSLLQHVTSAVSGVCLGWWCWRGESNRESGRGSV